MSPEQSGGYGQLDGRADIYSLGCVLYEMLVGEPPYSGRSSHAILARHSVERVPSVRAVRETVPWAVEQAIHKALAKVPADRFTTAAEFAAALAPDRITQPMPVVRPKSARFWKMATITVAGLALAALLLWRPWKALGGGRAIPLSDNTVAVLPFQVSIDASSALTRTASTAADLTVQRLPDEGGLHAASPSQVDVAIADLRSQPGRPLTADEASQVGRRVGAGLLLNGRLTPAVGGLAVSAALVDVRTGTVRARSPEVIAKEDSLPAALDRVVAALLISLNHRDHQRDDLLRRPLAAVRA
jgi:hypothetical protein